MIKGEIDRPKLEKSLKRFAKEFGDTNAQALVRWSVQACRELAFETQVWGQTKTRAKQEGAILADAYNVLLVVDEVNGLRVTNQGKTYSIGRDKFLTDPESVNDWIEINRTRRRARTAVLPITERKVVAVEIFKKAMRMRFARAGMAKGGWIGAGQDIAKAQTGMDRVAIGKNFLSYAQKHGKFGSSKKPRGGWKPFCEITNRVAHSSHSHVLTAQAPARAFAWSLKKTVKWYSSALKRQNQKQKP